MTRKDVCDVTDVTEMLIHIINSSIKSYEDKLTTCADSEIEYINKKILEEQKKLENLREEYPEYFI